MSTDETPSRSWYERVDLFRRHKRLIVGVFAAITAIYVPFVLGMPNLYRATAKVVVEGHPDPRTSPEGPLEVNNRLQAIKQLAFSRTELRQLADRHHLYGNLLRESEQDRVERLQHEIKVEVIGSDQTQGSTAVAFQVSYIGTDPKTAADVANTLASFYVSQNDKIKTRAATQNSQLLASQLEATRLRLTEQEGRLRAYTAANTGTLPQQTDANIAALERLNTQLRLNGEEQMRLMERRQTLQNQIATQAADLTPKPEAKDPNDPVERLAAMKTQLAELRTKWTDQAPDVRELQQQIKALEPAAAVSAARNRATRSSSTSPQSTLESALAETNTKLDELAKENEGLRRMMSGYEARVDSAPVRGQQLATLSSDAQVTRDIYDSLQKRYHEATLTEQAGSDSSEEFRVLDAAIPPAESAGPRRGMLVLVGLAIALALAIGTAMLSDRFDTSFHSIDDLREFTRVPVLATIPNIVTTHGRSLSRGRAAMWTVAGAGTAVALALVAFRFGQGAEPMARLLMKLGAL